MQEQTAKTEQLCELLDHFDTAMLITQASGGGMHARPMAVAALNEDGYAYFATGADSPKVDEVQNDPQVTLTFQDDKQFVSLYGTASVVRDRALIDRLWREAWKVWFPRGKEDPNLVLLRVDAREGEYWNNAGAQGLKYALKAAKAYLQGETPRADDPKQHGSVRL